MGENNYDRLNQLETCVEMAKYLKEKMGRRINFSDIKYHGLMFGTYISSTGDGEFDYLYGVQLPFHLEIFRDEFLRIQIGSFLYRKNSEGEKLAALSHFYEVLSEKYGSPSLFYKMKNDLAGMLTLQWSFKGKTNKLPDVERIDQLITIGKSTWQIDGYQFSDKTRKIVAKQIGLPFDLIRLVDENFDDYVKYKIGTQKNTENSKTFQKTIKKGDNL